MTPKEMEEYVQFIVWTVTLIMKVGDTLMDELNLHITYFKGVDILTYYIPTDPTKDKEPKNISPRKQSSKSVNWRRKVKQGLKINSSKAQLRGKGPEKRQKRTKK